MWSLCCGRSLCVVGVVGGANCVLWVWSVCCGCGLCLVCCGCGLCVVGVVCESWAGLTVN